MDMKALTERAGVSARTVHFYVQQGLIPPPSGGGRGARYSADHLRRLQVIKRLQAQHLPLAEIRRHLETPPPDVDESDEAWPQALIGEPESVSASATEPSADTAAAYLRRVFSRTAPTRPTSPPARPDALMRRATRMSSPTEGLAARMPPAAPTERSYWERHALTPDVEVHIRRPLTRPMNRKLELLLDYARSLLKEEE